MSGKRPVPPVRNLDGIIVIMVGIVSFVGMCALTDVIGWRGDLLWLGTVVTVGVSGALTLTAMLVTNRLAWRRQALRHARAINAR
jgi:hypothetical protein